jgi:L-ascorbate metabolism protein UlaG (beta-lactamase superfamily)
VRATAGESRPQPTALGLTWIGHSTVALALDGATVLTDPALGTRMAHLVRIAAGADAVPDSIDAVLISHTHRDHFDFPSLRRLPHGVLVVVPRGAGRLVTRLRFADVVEVVEGDELHVGSLRVQATHAEHARGRGVLPGGADAVGYLLGGSLTAYFAGDTDLFDGMAALAPSLDLALLPVSGWGPRVPAGHLDPERAARALALLRPRVAVPIHWGTYRPFYRRSPYPSDLGSAARFVELAHELAPEVDVRILSPGGRSTVHPAGMV